jgi:hypothetical protein
MDLYVVGKVFGMSQVGYLKNNWSFEGVFDSRDKAINACKNNTYFIGPVKLNEVLNERIIEWPNAYYPTIKEGYIQKYKKEDV